MTRSSGALSLFVVLVWAASGCSGDEFTASNGDDGAAAGGSDSGGHGGSGGKGGSVQGGSGGDTSGGSKSGGTGGTGGTGTRGGTGGSSTGGSPTGGDAGDGASGGNAGTGMGGSTGASGGAGGLGGSAGSAGTGGRGGTGGFAGTAGTGGSASTTCPPTAPVAGSACARNDFCSYGAHPLDRCRDIYTCVQGSWQRMAPGCSEPPSCGSTGTPPVVGAQCANDGLVCLNGQNTFCLCAADCPSVCSFPPIWHCFGADAGCPALLPNHGQPCSGSTSCIYGTCRSQTAINVVCENGVWDWRGAACPN